MSPGPVRILYLNPCARLGGAETSLYELLASLRGRQPDWPLHVWLGEDGPFVAMVRALGVEVTVAELPKLLASVGDAGVGGIAGKAELALRLACAVPGAAAYGRRLGRFAASWRPDIVHTTGFKMHLLGALATPKGTPLVWHMHDYVSKRAVMRRLLAMQARRCRAVLVNSRSVGRDCNGFGQAALRMEVLYNAIDLERFTPSGPAIDLDARAGLEPAPPGTIRVGLVGTFAKWKGHATFLEALAKIPKTVPLRAYIAGDAIYRRSASQHTRAGLKEMAERLGVRVGLTGFIEDAAQAMRALDIVVHASTDPEPFGMVIAEGMACGKAVVASRAGGALEIIEEGVTALAHEPGNPEELAGCIERLAGDAELRRRLGAAGRKSVASRFGRRQLGHQLAAIYEELAGKRENVLAGTPR